MRCSFLCSMFWSIRATLTFTHWININQRSNKISEIVLCYLGGNSNCVMSRLRAATRTNTNFPVSTWWRHLKTLGRTPQDTRPVVLGSWPRSMPVLSSSISFLGFRYELPIHCFLWKKNWNAYFIPLAIDRDEEGMPAMRNHRRIGFGTLVPWIQDFPWGFRLCIDVGEGRELRPHRDRRARAIRRRREKSWTPPSRRSDGSRCEEASYSTISTKTVCPSQDRFSCRWLGIRVLVSPYNGTFYQLSIWRMRFGILAHTRAKKSGWGFWIRDQRPPIFIQSISSPRTWPIYSFSETFK